MPEAMELISMRFELKSSGSESELSIATLAPRLHYSMVPSARSPVSTV